MTRYALISSTSEQLEAYMPGNYRVVGRTASATLIEGEDNAGWTLDDYVIPRLQSGLYYCSELTHQEAIVIKQIITCAPQGTEVSP